TPFPAGVGVREYGDSRGLRGTWWHDEDARKQFRGAAQPHLNKKLTTPRRQPNWPAKSPELQSMHRSDTLSSPPVRAPESYAAGLPPTLSHVPKLSVIVPFYNVQQYAPDTLRSLRLNAQRDFEFVL